jgi:hypothetical protein
MFERFNAVFIDLYSLGGDAKSLFSDHFSRNKKLGRITLLSSSNRIPHYSTGIISGMVSHRIPYANFRVWSPNVFLKWNHTGIRNATSFSHIWIQIYRQRVTMYNKISNDDLQQRSIATDWSQNDQNKLKMSTKTTPFLFKSRIWNKTWWPDQVLGWNKYFLKE